MDWFIYCPEVRVKRKQRHTFPTNEAHYWLLKCWSEIILTKWSCYSYCFFTPMKEHLLLHFKVNLLKVISVLSHNDSQMNSLFALQWENRVVYSDLIAASSIDLVITDASSPSVAYVDSDSCEFMRVLWSHTNRKQGWMSQQTCPMTFRFWELWKNSVTSFSSNMI